jgi:glycosyltransferase involved in cell wall biosynthesis
MSDSTTPRTRGRGTNHLMARTVFGVTLYESAAHVPEALETLLCQREGDLALVMVDDASRDATARIAARYAELDPRATLVRNPERLGLVGSWRRALELAREHHPEAEYFAWASDHDAWSPRWLERLAAELDAHPEAVLAYPQSVRIGERGEALREQPPWSFDTAGVVDPARRLAQFARAAVAGDMVYGLFRIDPLTRLGFPGALAPDRLLLARMCLAGQFRQVPEVLWHRRYVTKVSSRRQRAAFFPRGAPVWSWLPWPLAHFALLARDLALRGAERPRIGRVAGLVLAARYLWHSTARQVRKQALRPIGLASRLLRRGLRALGSR